MVSISDFMDLQQLVAELQTISFPEHLYLENWNFYIVALIEIMAVALMLHGAFFILTRSCFKYTSSLNSLRTFVWELSRFFYHSIFIFIIFGAFLFILGLPVPDKNSVTYLWPIFGLIGCVIGLARLFRDDGSFFTVHKDTTSKVLEGLAIIFLYIGFSLFALSCAYGMVSSDSNAFYGYIFADINSEYEMGDIVSIPIKIGGPDSGLSVSLLLDDPSGLKQISSLCLYSNNSSTQFSDTLVGNKREAGDYLIFLDTTSLPSGHYRLMFENPKYEWINLSSPFFLSPK